MPDSASIDPQMTDVVNPPRRKRRVFRWWMAPVLLVLGLYALRFVNSIPESEGEWYRKNAERLAQTKITPEMIANAPRWTQRRDQWCTELLAHKDAVRVGDNGGVYVVWHSFHDGEGAPFLLQRLRLFYRIHGREVYPVSDALLAVDQEGRMYTNSGHICGAVYFTSKKEVKTIDDFLQTTVGENEPWKPYVPVKEDQAKQD